MSSATTTDCLVPSLKEGRDPITAPWAEGDRFKPGWHWTRSLLAEPDG